MYLAFVYGPNPARPPEALDSLQQYDVVVGRLLMCSKGLSGTLPDYAKHLIQLPLSWGGFGARSTSVAASCGQAFIAGWVLVCNDLELLYPAVILRLGVELFSQNDTKLPRG